MTRAPDNLLAVRRLLLDHLDLDPTRSRPTDLDPAEAGIVGDAAHVGGYHCGSDRVRRVDGVVRDYSVTESSRDRAGLSEYASALDVGEFAVTVRGRTYDLRHFSAWLVSQCTAGAPDTRDIREVIWSPDGRTVRRWDRLGIRSTGDGTHRWHTHISYFRDATKAGQDLTPLYRRYLTTIGLIQASKGDDMPTVSEIWGAGFGSGDNRRTAGQLLAEARNSAVAAEARAAGLEVRLTGLEAVIVPLAEAIRAGGGSIDTAAILSGVDQRVTAAVTEITAQTRDAVADLGEGGAEQVRGGQGQAGG